MLWLFYTFGKSPTMNARAFASKRERDTFAGSLLAEAKRTKRAVEFFKDATGKKKRPGRKLVLR